MRSLGTPLLRARLVDSTMLWARRELEAGRAGPGSAFLADAQTAGRGRHGRSWASPPRRGLYLTLVLDESLAEPAVTLAAAVAVAEAIADSCGIHPGLKWPNDLQVGGRKLAGLLAEVVTDGDRTAVLLGLGVNLTQGEDDFDAELAGRATSLRLEGARVDADRLLRAILVRLEGRLREFAAGGFAAVSDAYLKRAEFAAGDRLDISRGDGTDCTATFVGLDSGGRLLVEESPEPIASGAVLRIRKGSRT